MIDRPEGAFPATMEAKLHRAASLANALALAIGGMGRIAIDDEAAQSALQWLADDVREAAQECFELWIEARGNNVAAGPADAPAA